MKLELSYIQNTQQRKAWPQREKKRVHLLEDILVTAPVLHLDTSWLNLDAPLNTAREGATKREKIIHQKNNKKRNRFKNTDTKIINRVRIVIRWSSSCRILNYTTEAGVATERERESSLTATHICHRPRIPFRHVLIELLCGLKHCKRGCNEEIKK